MSFERFPRYYPFIMSFGDFFVASRSNLCTKQFMWRHRNDIKYPMFQIFCWLL